MLYLKIYTYILLYLVFTRAFCVVGAGMFVDGVDAIFNAFAAHILHKERLFLKVRNKRTRITANADAWVIAVLN